MNRRVSATMTGPGLRALTLLVTLILPACSGGIPLRDQVSAGKILALLAVVVAVLLLGLYGARPRD
jgi:hypothetical protein